MSKINLQIKQSSNSCCTYCNEYDRVPIETGCQTLFTRGEGNKATHLCACEALRLNSAVMNFRVTPGFLVESIRTFLIYGLKFQARF